MKTGQISVQSENIFPIIKKFLYTDQEIFVRELVSNAVDATKKIQTLSRIGEYSGDVEDLKVEVSIDEKKKTLTISDYGVGMTEDEIEKYITQLAFSRSNNNHLFWLLWQYHSIAVSNYIFTINRNIW